MRHSLYSESEYTLARPESLLEDDAKATPHAMFLETNR